LVLSSLAPLSCSSIVPDPGDKPASPRAPDSPMVLPAADRSVGAPCAFDTQCSTHRCSADIESGGCGECVTIEPLGQACVGPHQGCSISAVCLGGYCQSLRKSVGQPCALGAKGYDFGDCDVDLACESFGSFDSGICLRLPRAGESCAGSPLPCLGNALCDPTIHVCVPHEPTCLEGYPCGPKAVCGSDALCHPGALPEGATCPIDGSDACAPELICKQVVTPDGATRTCAPPLGKGESCDREDCADGLFCFRPQEGGPGSCDSPRGEGEKCSDDFHARNACAAPLECRDGTCKIACQ
jgi:hypothetical protein